MDLNARRINKPADTYPTSVSFLRNKHFFGISSGILARRASGKIVIEERVFRKNERGQRERGNAISINYKFQREIPRNIYQMLDGKNARDASARVIAVS